MRSLPPRSARALRVVALVLALGVAAAGCAGKSASSKPPAGAAAGGAPPPAADKPYGDWTKLTKDTQTLSGFFTLHRKRENLYMEIKPDQLDTPVLGIFSLSRGIGTNFVLRSEEHTS